MRYVLVGLFVVACKGQSQPPPPGDNPASAAAPVKLAPRDLGSCTLKATGAVTVEATSPGGRTAVSSKHWSSEGESGVSQAGLIINCMSKELRLSIVTKPDTAVPFGPKTYTIDGKTGDLVIVGRATDQALEELKGNVEITTFDGTHVVGTIALTARRAHVAGTISLDGHFDLACPGYSNCSR